MSVGAMLEEHDVSGFSEVEEEKKNNNNRKWSGFVRVGDTYADPEYAIVMTMKNGITNPTIFGYIFGWWSNNAL